MDQRVAPAHDRRFSEPQIILLGRAENSPSTVLRRSVDVPTAQCRCGTRFKLFGILLLAPAIIILTAPILVALLGIFVIWLAIVGAMAAAIVMTDLIRGLTWHLRHALRALDQRAIPAGQ